MKVRGSTKKLLPERLWIFDFDGTLSPFVSDRSKAALHPQCKNLLLDLTASNDQHVAILSSRTLDDLMRRVDIYGVYCGGNCGVEWCLPGNTRLTFAGLLEADLSSARNLLAHRLSLLRAPPGVEIEDKKWSITIHLRQASPHIRAKVNKIVSQFGFQTFKGHEALEIAMIKNMNKKFGVSVLCDKIFEYNADKCHLIYAGDDENDRLAMSYVLSRGGLAISVGDEPLVADAIMVTSPEDLAVTCRELFGI